MNGTKLRKKDHFKSFIALVYTVYLKCPKGDENGKFFLENLTPP